MSWKIIKLTNQSQAGTMGDIQIDFDHRQTTKLLMQLAHTLTYGQCTTNGAGSYISRHVIALHCHSYFELLFTCYSFIFIGSHACCHMLSLILCKVLPPIQPMGFSLFFLPLIPFQPTLHQEHQGLCRS